MERKYNCTESYLILRKIESKIVKKEYGSIEFVGSAHDIFSHLSDVSDVLDDMWDRIRHQNAIIFELQKTAINDLRDLASRMEKHWESSNIISADKNG